MKTPLFGLCSLFLFLAAAVQVQAQAQDTAQQTNADVINGDLAAPSPLAAPTNEEIMGAVQSLARDVRQLRQEVDFNQDDLTSLENQVRALSQNLTEVSTLVGQNREDIMALHEVISDEIEKQRQILAAISATDTEGRAIPRLSAIMDESPEFREDVKRAVHAAMDDRGQLLIENKTTTYRRIFVNRVEYGVQPGETISIDVPVGTVSTQLPGQELKTWSVTAPNYRERIEIVPTNQVTAFRPVTAARPVAEAPVISETVTETWYPSFYYFWP